jgi:hypothetical protein
LGGLGGQYSSVGGQYSSVDLSNVQGSTIGASLDDVPACGNSGITSSGVWYTVKGNGGPMRTSPVDFEEGTDFDARVSVFRGSCSSLECVEQDDSLRWDSILDELYYILVYGVKGSAGNFGLIVGNAFCFDVANSLPADFTFATGMTLNGPDASTLPVCEVSSFRGGGGSIAWLVVVGTGEILRASSCVLPREFDLSVYSGDCETLSCVQEVDAGFDEYANYGGYGGAFLCETRVSWQSVADELYFIMVQGVGEYAIRVNP